MDLQLQDKVVVVTGAGRGIGLATVAALGREGARVVAGSRTRTDELATLGDKYPVEIVTLDLATPDGPAALVEKAVQVHGGIDAVVNNVGAAVPRGGFLAVADADWQSIFETNFFSAVRTARAALPHLLARRGCIVNVGSVNARQPAAMVVDYSAAKAALSNLTKTLSEEFAPQGVRVNGVAPGPVRTPMWTADGGFGDAVAGMAGVTREHAITAAVPQMMQLALGRFAEPDEVADLITYLLSDRAAAITGAELTIDSGMVKTL